MTAGQGGNSRLQITISPAIHNPTTGPITSLLVRHRRLYLSGLNPAQMQPVRNAKFTSTYSGNILHIPAIL
ncbi:MAG TPA: hypothetical protein DCR06_03355 [Planctomycetaceae bacterium]|nr:hypothetical protein [Planctomycetaceae bacterium]